MKTPLRAALLGLVLGTARAAVPARADPVTIRIG